MRVVFLRRARADLTRLRKFLEPHGEALAARTYDLLFEAARSLAEYPERGQPRLGRPTGSSSCHWAAAAMSFATG
jgi:plasmid stabilization system protein ParE